MEAGAILQKPETRERLMSLVEFDTNGGCWLWIGRLRDGYGRFSLNRTIKMTAHHASFLIHGGNVQPGQVLMHSCDVCACVNPDHLKAGTSKQNAQDAVDRNRRKPFQGKKVTEAVRSAVLRHAGSLREISRDLSVPKTTIIMIRKQANGGH